jgi:hypothetical protein
MKQLTRSLVPVLVVLSLGLVAPSARAQAPTPPRTAGPAVSPYLNLLRRGSDPAINYYGLVRPQVDFRNSIQNLQQQVSAQAAGTGLEGQAAGLPPTGHAVQFMSYGGYFGRSLIGSAGRAPGASASSASPGPQTRSGHTSSRPAGR